MTFGLETEQAYFIRQTYLTGAEPRPTERDPPARKGKRRTSRRSSMPSCKQAIAAQQCKPTINHCHHLTAVNAQSNQKALREHIPV